MKDFYSFLYVCFFFWPGFAGPWMPICQSIAVLRVHQRTYAVWLLGGSKLPEGAGSGTGGQGSGLRRDTVLEQTLPQSGATSILI